MPSISTLLGRAVLGLLLTLPCLLGAADIMVTSTTDGADGSLRDAIAQAQDGDNVIFSSFLFGNLTLTQGEIEISNDINIIGIASPTTSVDAGGNSRIFSIVGDAAVTISNIYLRNGSAVENGGAILISDDASVSFDGVFIVDSNVSGSAVTHGGGAIAVMGGEVTINNSTFSGNTATGTPASGGAIILLGDGNLTVTNSTFTSNTSTRAGGAIEGNADAGSTITLVNVTFQTNTTGPSPGNGGAVHITGPGDIDVTSGLVTGNVATAEGGGLWNGAGVMNVDGVTITGNVAVGNDADQGGGGIFNQAGTVNIFNATTVANNGATGTAGSGGGIFNNTGGVLTVTDSRIEANTSERAGGGIEDNSGAEGMVTLTNVMMIDNVTNTSPGNGGGVHITGPGNIDVTGGTYSGNTAGAEGGALWNGAGVMNVSGATIMNNVASGDDADQGGGGIFNLRGTVNVMNGTVIMNNVADGDAGSGGGILNDTLATLTVRNTMIMGNVSNRAGGGIEDNSRESTTVTLDSVRLINNTTNTSPGNGGGVHITGAGNMTINATEVSGNSAGAEGGGLWNGSGTMTVTNSTISDNTALGSEGDQGGGGLFNVAGTLTVMNSTISGNTAPNAGGGGITNAGTLTVEQSTVALNSAAFGGAIQQNAAANSTTLTANIIARNSGDDGSNFSGMGTFASEGSNFIESPGDAFTSDDSDATTTGTDTLTLNLQPLADNGGFTQTHALGCPSVAIDAGGTGDGPDQRGEPVFGGARDAGAFERQEICETSVGNLLPLVGSSVYPNPTDGTLLNVELAPEAGNRIDARLIELSTGRVVLSRQLPVGVTPLNLTRVPSGMYVLELTGERNYVAHRVVVTR